MADPVLTTGAFTGMSPADEAQARVMISALQHRYAAFARLDLDRSLMPTLFEPDGIVVFPDGREKSPTQMHEIAEGVAEQPKILRHHITTNDVQFVSADEAHSQTFVIASTDTKIVDHWGEWLDVIRRQSDGRWLFSRKKIVALGNEPGGWLDGHMKALSQNQTSQ